MRDAAACDIPHVFTASGDGNGQEVYQFLKTSIDKEASATPPFLLRLRLIRRRAARFYGGVIIFCGIYNIWPVALSCSIVAHWSSSVLFDVIFSGNL